MQYAYRAEFGVVVALKINECRQRFEVLSNDIQQDEEMGPFAPIS